MPCALEQTIETKIRSSESVQRCLYQAHRLSSAAVGSPAAIGRCAALFSSVSLNSPASLSISQPHYTTETTTMTSEKPAEGKPAGVSLPGGELLSFFFS